MKDNIITLNESLLVLLKKKRECVKKKKELIAKQSYEKAAMERDKEKSINIDILDFLKEELKYDFSNSRQVQTDIMKILDLVQDGDTDLTNAINKLEVLDLERLKLMKDIERYNLNQITLDDLHKGIKTSFAVVIEDFKNQIKRL